MLSMNFQKMRQDIFISLRRFPFAVCCSILLTLIALNRSSLPQHWHFDALCFIFFIGIFLFISVKLMSESFKMSSAALTGLGLVIFVILSAYVYNLQILTYPFVLMSLGGALLTMIAPFLKKEVEKETIWKFNYRLWSQFFFSLLASLILGLGLNFVLLSLDYLFHVRLFDDQYFKLAVIIGCFITPMMVLSGIPSKFNDLPSPQEGKGIQLLIDYIMAPILIVFGLIIITYAFKILALQNLPRGRVSYLVSVLGGTGTITYLLGESGRTLNSFAHRLFRKHFFHMMIVPLILMGVGICVRINQYGITELRYLDALLLFWLTLCVIYSLVQPRGKLFQFISATASALLILSSFGPWGIQEMSTSSQFYRLQTLLEKNQILINNKIQQQHPPINEKAAYEITSRLFYIVQRGKAERIKGWFEPEAQRLFNIPNTKLIPIEDLTNQMSIKYVPWVSQKMKKSTFSVAHSQDKSDWFAVSGYDYVLPIDNIYIHEEAAIRKGINKTYYIPKPGITLILKLEESTQTLTIKRQGESKALIGVPISNVLHTLNTAPSPSSIDKMLTFEGTDGHLSTRLIIRSIQGNTLPGQDFPQLESMKLMLLIKIGR